MRYLSVETIHVIIKICPNYNQHTNEQIYLYLRRLTTLFSLFSGHSLQESVFLQSGTTSSMSFGEVFNLEAVTVCIYDYFVYRYSVWNKIMSSLIVQNKVGWTLNYLVLLSHLIQFFWEHWIRQLISILQLAPLNRNQLMKYYFLGAQYPRMQCCKRIYK